MSDFTQKTLEKIKAGSGSNKSEKKKRLSRIILFIDIVLVVVILILFSRQSPDIIYHTTSITYNEILYRISLSKEKKTNNLLFSLTVKSNSVKEKTQSYLKSIIHLTVGHNDNVLFKSILGDNITIIKLLPGELKTFVQEIDTFVLKNFAEQHPEFVIPKEKSLFMTEKRHIPMYVIVTLNTKENISTRLEFNYEVE